MKNFKWEVVKKDSFSNARCGNINTPHGTIQTPAFIFCATKASLKSLSAQQAKENDTQIILSNTYHLMLQPGDETISNQGGLHNFMNWKGPILTDSGGFQLFSLGYGSVADEIKGKRNLSNRKKSLIKVTEEGAIFKSYLDGSKHLLSPEKSIKIQRNLGADLILVFDECTPYNITKSETAASMERSHRWSARSIEEFYTSNYYPSMKGVSGNQKLYGIIQGGIYEDLRNESIDFNLKNDFFGLAIGGSLGATKKEMYNVVKYTTNNLGEKFPIHLLGIGDPIDIWTLVKFGIDTFDCVMPTRIARHGVALTRENSKGKINLKNAKYKNDKNPLELGCKCNTCTNYYRSYIHHLFKSGEILGLQLISLHNIYFMNFMMQTIRDSIKNDNFENAKNDWFSA
ncbi:MAG: Queuine tRNA-ribosyltransferase [Alphaproteobacteria bacterium MarineAlpha5_Bin11]|nr:tRNA guanosine(34) transglycosylase Tgt [Pelagibacteraceae bacterium]PPR43349.1 MAG: Queuine tRNA-ribosyltransferase [Alphaproteobacteria bacterium MarineAlpha5_Bin11]PPR52035.1 MAG: Queuine tRNA-ribosyltransferase [Alphaproteobacteria bacterium MarineAlpha5_Bin10]|tara:strand:+ start:6673 stop:7872 length:1200 start_codon:yes stop_codon:yes gene_type:complete